jgi:hypothetical protein
MASQPTREILISQAKGIVKWPFCSDAAQRCEQSEIVWQQFQSEFLMITETRRQSPARQMFRYIGVIAMIMVVVAALCWGFLHI